MRNLIVPIFLGLMCISFTIIPAESTKSRTADVVTVSPNVFTDSSLTAIDAGISLYKSSNLEQYNLSEEAFTNAWKGYQYLLNKKMISRISYLTICDFSQSSRQKRLYILDIDNKKLIIHTYVAHGKNSGTDYATSFSNTVESLQSSLGFYITSNTYIGKHGLSLRINGVDPGFNDKALERTIVIHGASYVNEARARSGMYMGRSWGCPAVPENESAKIITTIKNGTCLFIYHPSRNYLLSSKILND